ncbi:hypothetical protein EWM64_g5855 [Hericium alpestre]|uniref:DUF676 domain-containing protein n=1 Tax=Hericium alpestre TaxID=135208 RepID=A0A4Y9ZVR6_9AGAM|nr:hypothetical protein EWM64_g5855 [Hericium alpestre]
MANTDVHLLVLIHGMWGNPSHLAEMHRHIHEIRQEPADADPDSMKLRVLLAETNREEGTYDGIDWGGERVAEEVMDEISKIKAEGKNVTRFSITGYSLGGLVARYVVGILHQRKLFDTITPVNFNTIATPHIGLLRYPSFMSKLFSMLGPRLLSRTGEQFYGVDKWSAGGRPLLEVMADPERIFYQALASFQHICIYANAVNDITVPYITAAIEPEDPFMEHETNGLAVTLDEKYSPLIESWTLPAEPPTQPPQVWYKSLGARIPRLPLPPRLVASFPYNILIYTSFPILLPTLVTLVVIRLSLAAHSSRGRIRLLEAEDTENAGERLVHVFAGLERQMEEAVVDIIDEGVPIEPVQERQQHPSASASPSPTPTAAEDAVADALADTRKCRHKRKGDEKAERRAAVHHARAAPHDRRAERDPAPAEGTRVHRGHP